MNAATQHCCWAYLWKTDKKETSQVDGFLFASDLCFAPIPILSPKSETVIHPAADIDVCEQLRPAYAYDTKKHFWDMALSLLAGSRLFLEQDMRSH